MHYKSLSSSEKRWYVLLGQLFWRNTDNSAFAQKITYGKGKSDIIARLDGTAKMPEVKGDSGASTELQKSIFNAPSMITSGQPAQALPPVPPAPAAETPQGTKRQREDESDEEGAPMEEDDDEGEAMMEESDED